VRRQDIATRDGPERQLDIDIKSTYGHLDTVVGEDKGGVNAAELGGRSHFKMETI
jgi:hypothetical protein